MDGTERIIPGVGWALASAARVIAFGALGGAAAGLGRGRSWRWWLAEVLAAVTLLAVAMLAGIGLGSAEWGMARLGPTLLLAALAVGLVGAIVSRDRSTGHLRALVVAVGLGMLATVATGLGLRFIGPSPEAVVSLPRLLSHPWMHVSDFRDFPVSHGTETLVNVETGAWLMLGPTRFDGCFIDGPSESRTNHPADRRRERSRRAGMGGGSLRRNAPLLARGRWSPHLHRLAEGLGLRRAS